MINKIDPRSSLAHTALRLSTIISVVPVPYWLGPPGNFILSLFLNMFLFCYLYTIYLKLNFLQRDRVRIFLGQSGNRKPKHTWPK